jgi:carbonic anhydrase
MSADPWYAKRLAAGVRQFRTGVFPRRRAFFERLAKGQSPPALFITCADSRVVPSLVTHTRPGELFVERNPGNIVPMYKRQAVGVSASIEYAVAALGVRHVIVCGHTECGAVKAMLDPEQGKGLPAVRRWLAYGERAVQRLARERKRARNTEKVERLIRLNVLAQLDNLMTHPAVRKSVAAGTLELHGWVYDIDDGAIFAHDPATGEFPRWPD